MFKEPNFLDQLYSRLISGGKNLTRFKGPTEAQKRYRPKLVAKRKANAEIPDTSVETRQRRRQSERMRTKQRLTVAKQRALSRTSKLKGGAAAVRTPADVEAVMLG